MRQAALRAAIAVALSVSGAIPSEAQGPRPQSSTLDWVTLAYEPGSALGVSGPARGLRALQSEEPASTSVLPAALSFLVPGTGQHHLGQRRRWLYWTLEAVGWAAYLNRRGAGASARDAYRDFAWSQARFQTSPRVDGDFSYYETMSQWDRSGSFDTDAGAAGVQPEMDASTFNGAVWGLATGIFFPPGPTPGPSDPAYQSAVAYYEERAYGAAFLWDWSGVPGGRGAFGGLIQESDRGFRQATNVLGAILAHHVVSAVDAFVSSRSGNAVGAEVVPGSGGVTGSWEARLTVPLGR